MRVVRTSAFVFCSFLALSCVKAVVIRPPAYPVPAPSCDGVAADLAALTFNAGLAPGATPHSAPRSPFVASAVAEEPFDLLCLQEAWSDADRDGIIARLGLPTENVFFADTAGLGETGEDRCGSGMLDRLSACAREKCSGSSEEDLTRCALSQCRSALVGIFFQDRDCVNCLAAMAGNGIDEVVRQCSGPGRSRIYGGRNGVILASRWPLKDRATLLLPASNANRVGLFARVTVPGRGDVEVACTHFSSSQDIPPSHSGRGSWSDEKAAQLDAISARLAGRAGALPQLLLGDLNFGPAGESASVWERAISAGLTDPAAYPQPPLCSICPDNAFVDDAAAGTLVDHVLLRDQPGGVTVTPACVERAFDRPLNVDGAAMHLSDHFGIRARFLLR